MFDEITFPLGAYSKDNVSYKLLSVQVPIQLRDHLVVIYLEGRTSLGENLGEIMANLPKGFYTGPDGKERFWDGKEWFTSNQKENGAGLSTRTEKIRPNRHTSRNTVLLLAAVVTIAVGSWAAISSQTSIQDSIQKNEGVIDDQEREDIIAQNQAIVDENAVANREQAIEQLEKDIKKLAKKQAEDGIISGPVLSVQCTPTGGYSLSDLEIRSMKFECFVANEDLGGGTLRGVDYHALANWDDGTFTFGLGKN